jgi:hypothetical protein
MQKLVLQHDEPLSGKFSLKKLNFLFVFQVNCPGCFLYGFPLVNQLYEDFSQNISFLGISTAFEDFEFNNEKNTNLLLESKQVVGETKRALHQQGLDTYQYPIRFPIAMDKKADVSFDYDLAATRLCELNPYFSARSKTEQKAFAQNALKYLKGQELISLTFTLNQLRGTPTFLLITDTCEILYHSFGHVDNLELKKQLRYFVDKYN